jgi:hypothetical protein
MRVCDVYHRLRSHPSFDDDTERRIGRSAEIDGLIAVAGSRDAFF